MTTLQRKGASGIPMHPCAPTSPAISRSASPQSGIHIPRHTGACPRWNVYSAFLSPERLSTSRSQEMPDGARFFCVARTVTKGAYRYNAPVRHVAIGWHRLLPRSCRELIYSDGMDLAS